MAGQPVKLAIVLLGSGAFATARLIQALYPDAPIHGLRQRVAGVDVPYDDFGALLRELYRSGTGIIALCSAGIVVRTLAPLLGDKSVEPPVLAVAEDGSAVVPLLGGTGGVNVLARALAERLGVRAAITTSGELRFGTCLLDPPAGYTLADIEQGKHFVADLLGGATVAIDGDAPWLADAGLALAADARHRIRISPMAAPAASDELVIHPRCAAIAIGSAAAGLADAIAALLRQADIAAPALACLVASRHSMGATELEAAATYFGVPLRFVDAPLQAQAILGATGIAFNGAPVESAGLALGIAEKPLDTAAIGRARGRLTVVGLGPGAAGFMVPAARGALDEADDILGYATYVRMAGPFRPEQVLHCTDNREELQRARHAFELAASGRAAVLVSSGDPGVFAMAAAVFEVLEASAEPAWHSIDLRILPGVSAALATAARAGAPLGHDFCMISLSDNLKPWAQIEARLEHAVAGDFVLALYNPISKARPLQLGRALEIIARVRTPATVVVLGRDIGRPGEALTFTTLGELRSDQVDSRTLVIIGSSHTRYFAQNGGAGWVYTPRWYEIDGGR
jgi:cobalt-precorrin 5A hydrolase / precorrin-3B C17-methyltransferase